MKRTTLPLPLQLSYLLLFTISMVAALWMKGHPVLTFALLGAVLPLGLLARVPERYFSQLMRQIVQILIAAGHPQWSLTSPFFGDVRSAHGFPPVRLIPQL